MKKSMLFLLSICLLRLKERCLFQLMFLGSWLTSSKVMLTLRAMGRKPGCSSRYLRRCLFHPKVMKYNKWSMIIQLNME
jgi:hypothetical protein